MSGIDHFRYASDASGYDWQATCHGFQYDVGTSFFRTCQAKQIRRAVPEGQLLVRASASQCYMVSNTQIADLLLECCPIRPVSHNEQCDVGMARSQSSNGFDQNLKALKLQEPPNAKHDSLAVGQSELLPG